jgi:hypothetical protein
MNSSNSFNSEEDSFDTGGEETESKTDKIELKLANSNLIKSISSALTMILDENKNLKNYKKILLAQKKMIFNAKSVPKISIYDYLKRIQTYSYIEKSTLIISLIYIDRICQIGHLTLTYYNIHRILFAAIIIAIKYNEDSFYDNKYYSEIAGVDLKELNIMENTFVEMCHFKLYIADEIFEKYYKYLNSLEDD